MKNKASFINFPIGNACNLRCKFCYNDTWREDKQFFDEFDVLLDRLSKYEFKEGKRINIIGGEPLMYPKIFDLLDYFKNNNYRVRIVTNGIKLGEEKFFKKFLKYKDLIENINFSIHSHTEILEEKITARKSTFNKKIKGIHLLKNNDIRFTLSLVINSYNINYLSDIVIYYKDHFGKAFSFQGMLTYSYFSKENIETVPKYDDLVKNINNVVATGNSIVRVHWIPLCIHNKVNNISYIIRELDKDFLYSSKWNGENLLASRIKHNNILPECKKCYAFGKFCYGPGKIYVEKYGYNEFNGLSREEVKKLILISNISLDNKKIKSI